MNPPLSKPLRKQLERVLGTVRGTAETAAHDVLEYLGVESNTPPDYLQDDKQELHRRLRAHGSLLGDRLCSETGTQETALLAEEIAYEHWNRMFFVRVLSENGFLFSDSSGSSAGRVSITLSECEYQARKKNDPKVDVWALAAEYSAPLLPQVFKIESPESPVFELQLPPEHQQKLEKQLRGLSAEIFRASDTLGWVYQYWQSKRKDEINESGAKVGARELPAMTQIFSEPYMVDFLLDNSLGAWWAAQQLSEADWNNAKSEMELREKAAIFSEVPLKYLRFVQSEKGAWMPAAGSFEDWPEQLSQFRLLDPCCGSGHFLVAALRMLVPMRMAREGLSACEAVDRVISENLYGLELDQRCVELAAFALGMAAWRYPGACGIRSLPQFNVACSGHGIEAKKEDWISLARDDQDLRVSLGEMYRLFQNAEFLGSLIDPESSTDKGPLFEQKWEENCSLLEKALAEEKTQDVQRSEMGIVAQGIAEATRILTKKYHCIVTNVPYLGRRRQSKRLRKFCEDHYPEAKGDLATVFLERILKMCAPGGMCSLVLPQNWLLQKTYQKFREKLLRRDRWRLLARLGPGAFETITGHVVKAILFSVTKTNDGHHGTSGEVSSKRPFYGLDVSKFKTVFDKATALLEATLVSLNQVEQLKNPDALITFDFLGHFKLLNSYARALKGFQTGDNGHFKRFFWELPECQRDWLYFQGTANKTCHYGGRRHLLWWGEGLEEAIDSKSALPTGRKAWGKRGVSVRLVAYKRLPCTLYSGEKFDDNCAVILPHCPEHLEAIWCFCTSSGYREVVKKISGKLNVTNATLAKVPFDLKYWTEVAAEKYPNGLPRPYSDDPTQWIFHGHPMTAKRRPANISDSHSDQDHVDGIATLQVAVARLLGYRWPAETDAEMTLSEEARSWVSKSKELCGQDYVDTDGIVCIPAVSGEMSAAVRLQKLLEEVYGDASARKKNELLVQAGTADGTLETWLRDEFFAQHCKLFLNRPFIWHIWDGLRGGFSVLVNYHKLNHKMLEALIHRYLADWLALQDHDRKDGKDGAEEKYDAATSLKKSLESILKGENPCDIFVRWKPLEKQPTGWHPDLNDGVRVNIRPFMKAPDIRKGAGVLRTKPNIEWAKDGRGKDRPSSPGYEFHGDRRRNDHHLNLKDKEQARSEKSEK